MKDKIHVILETPFIHTIEQDSDSLFFFEFICIISYKRTYNM